MSEQDLTLTAGDTFTHVFALFSDARVKRWRGEYHEFFVYKPGEAVELEPGEAFVALLRTMNVKPGEPGSETFWSPLTPKDLTGCTVSLVCGGLFTLEEEGKGVTVTPKTGTIEIEVEPKQTEKTPSSEHYYVQLEDVAKKLSTPISGVMLFKQP
jgi:hypothetical protein